ncbi:PIN domain-containing protein [Candidatus Woesearchaeota archaeon]|nr:PIN domain-containing protein [Candidatus Woesearchaeota archaeon]
MKYLDTYALVEIAHCNHKFSQYLDEDFIINDLTLTEFYYVLLKEVKDNQYHLAEYWFKKLQPYSKPVTISLLIKAADFRFKYRKKNLSFFDAIGYIFARQHNLIFVTGDKEFEKLPGIEFAKK